MIMCSETDFTQEKSHFHATTTIPNSSLLFAAALSLNGRIPVMGRRNGREKSIFCTPHNEIKCVLSIKESNINGTMGQSFHICGQGRELIKAQEQKRD